MKAEEVSMGLEMKKKKKRELSGRGSRRRRPTRRVLAERNAIQGLFEMSKAIFKGVGTIPSPKDVILMRQFLDKMRPEDFNLSADLDFFKAQSPVSGTPPPITYTIIYNCENFSMCMFFLPPTAVIPLHNHPGMTVFNKLVLGTMHITSYDWVDSTISGEAANPSNFRLAKLVTDSDFTAPCRTSTLYPTAGGNMHTFRAISPCVVLDVMGPPYSKKDDRDCTYYRRHPYAHISDGSTRREQEPDDALGWLEEIDMPTELEMVPIDYLGPQIIER